MRVPALLAACALLLATAAAPAGAQSRQPRAVLAFLPTGGQNNPKPVLDRLDARTQLPLGLLAANIFAPGSGFDRDRGPTVIRP